MIIELHEEGIADYIPDPYGTDAITEETSHSSSALGFSAESTLDECEEGSILAICKRLKLLQDAIAALAMRDMLCRHFWAWNADQ